jgi:glutamate 5-kinase
MAIRIRKVKKTTVAICAALSEAKEGDVYLDDGAHHALVTKFGLDWESMGFVKDSLADEELIPIMKKEEFKKQWINRNGDIILG